MDETTIDDSIHKYKTVDVLIGAVEKSDVELVKSILALKSTQAITEDVMNMTGIRSKRLVLHTCVTTMVGWDDEKPTQCPNYQIFDMLINQKGVNLRKLDDKGLNVWHKVFQTRKVSFLDLLVSKTSKSEWKEYFNTPIQKQVGSKCTHLALRAGDKRNIVMLEKLKQMSMDKKFKDVIDMRCKNIHSQTVFDIAFSSSRYFYATKLLFDEKDDHRGHINQIISHVLSSSDGYDAKNPLQSEHFQFFKVLCNQPGINGHYLMVGCAQNKKTAYLEHIMSKNDTFEQKFTLDNLWDQASHVYQCK